MKTPTTPPPTDPAEALLQGLIAECHAVIRDVLLPGLREVSHDDHRYHIHSITDLMSEAVKLSDAVGRLRGNQAQPKLRQRITVDKIQRLSPPQGEGG